MDAEHIVFALEALNGQSGLRCCTVPFSRHSLALGLSEFEWPGEATRG